MMTEFMYFDDHFSQATLDTVDAVIRDDDSSFTNLMRISKLDKCNDFQNADLRDIDFSNANLTGFNFSGSDLRGAFGVNVTFDNSTIFIGAQLSQSIFAFSVSKDLFFEEHPEWKKKYEKVKSGFWTDVICWVAENTKSTADSNDITTTVAKYIVDDSDDIVVRSQSLYFLSRTFRTAHEHIEFLLHTINRYSNDRKTIVIATRVLSELYSYNHVAYSALKNLAKDDNHEISREALFGLISSKFFSIDDIDLSSSYFDSSELRRRLVRSVAAKLGPEYTYVARDPNYGTPLDYEEKISDDTIRMISRSTLHNEKLNRVINDGLRRRGEQISVTVKRDEIEARAHIVKSRLERMIEYGIPFHFDKKSEF